MFVYIDAVGLAAWAVCGGADVENQKGIGTVSGEWGWGK